MRLCYCAEQSWFLVMAGKGSYGVVYKARDIRTLELVAVKVLSLSEGVCFFLLGLVSSVAFGLILNFSK